MNVKDTPLNLLQTHLKMQNTASIHLDFSSVQILSKVCNLLWMTQQKESVNLFSKLETLTFF